MGNRSHIIIRETKTQTDNFLILYSHWGGEDNWAAVKNVLAKTDRIGDHAYLAAQLFYEFTQLGDYVGTTGFGIWVGGLESLDESDNFAVVVDTDTGQVSNTGTMFRL
jgi:hypothetical protein